MAASCTAAARCPSRSRWPRLLLLTLGPLLFHSCNSGEVDLAESADGRSLQSQEDMALPDTHVLFMAESASVQPFPPCSSFCSAIQGASAGANYSILEIKIPGGSFQFTELVHGKARLKVVRNTLTEPEALAGGCRDGQPGVATAQEVAASWGSSTGAETTLLSADTLRADQYLEFRMGGNYRLCYSANGTFGENQADVTRQRIVVNGVFDLSTGCNTPNCLSNRRYDCYMRRNAFSTASGKYGMDTSCVIDYSYPGAGFYGPTGSGSWSSEFTSSGYDETTGASLGMKVQPCGTKPATFICRDGGACDAGNTFIAPEADSLDKKIMLPTT
ncbi:unnamed protein product, partial [Polarella glacialis]